MFAAERVIVACHALRAVRIVCATCRVAGAISVVAHGFCVTFISAYTAVVIVRVDVRLTVAKLVAVLFSSRTIGALSCIAFLCHRTIITNNAARFAAAAAHTDAV